MDSSLWNINVQAGGIRTLLSRIRSHSRPLFLIGAVSSMTSIGFPLSLQLTGSAEALLLISLSPLWGSLMGRFLGDELPLRTKLAVLGALCLIAVIFLPVIYLSGDNEFDRPNRLLGDVIAVLTGIGLGGYSNAVRYFSLRHPLLPTHAAQVLSSTNAVVICVFVMLATRRPFVIHQPTRVTWLTALMGFIVNAAYLSFNLAPRFINAAEFGIVCLLESILGPL